MDIEKHDNKKSHPHCWRVKDCSPFPLQPQHQCRNTVCHRLPPCDADNNQGKNVLQLPRIVRNTWGSELL